MPEYVVQGGDTLSGIAQKVGLGANWQGLGYAGDPRSLQVGTKLSWGSPASTNPQPAPSAGGIFPDQGSQQITDFSNQSSDQRNQLIQGQNTYADSLYKQLTDKMNGQEKLTDAYSRLSKENGLDVLNQSIQTYKNQLYNVKSLLSNLNNDVTKRTEGSFTNDSQRRRQVAAEGEPLNTQLTQLGDALQPQLEAYSAGQNAVSNQVSLLDKDQQNSLDPIKTQIGQLSDRFARELTGFNAGKEEQLAALKDKVDRGRQLSDREWELAQQLAAEERDFQREKEKMAISFANSKSLQGSDYNLGSELSALRGGQPGSSSDPLTDFTSLTADPAYDARKAERTGQISALDTEANKLRTGANTWNLAANAGDWLNATSNPVYYALQNQSKIKGVLGSLASKFSF